MYCLIKLKLEVPIKIVKFQVLLEMMFFLLIETKEDIELINKLRTCQ